ncbi:MAG: hypothetical protein SF028_03005 [Candidatus Sumerlaeia bacterium]|nr:hypothetical protein [Candidatus Sumerlaeia bacterium]
MHRSTELHRQLLREEMARVRLPQDAHTCLARYRAERSKWACGDRALIAEMLRRGDRIERLMGRAGELTEEELRTAAAAFHYLLKDDDHIDDDVHGAVGQVDDALVMAAADEALEGAFARLGIE